VKRLKSQRIRIETRANADTKFNER
jgi:hypothetical protein